MPVSNALEPEQISPAIFELAGRKVLVTGASKGIGRELAVGLAAFGASVACVARSEDGLGLTAKLVEERRGSALTYAADLSDPGALRDTIARAAADLGGLDVLVNNAGADHDGTIENTPPSAWQTINDLNCRSTYLACQEASPYLKDSGGYGKVINVASVLGHVGILDNTAYIMSKHAVIGLTKGLALEWARKGVQVNALCPGFIMTDMTAASHTDEASHRWVTQRTPMGRWGQSTDMVGAAVFLSSRASDFMTGQTLVVDGGWIAQ